jgi:hypothetical protein
MNDPRPDASAPFDRWMYDLHARQAAEQKRRDALYLWAVIARARGATAASKALADDMLTGGTVNPPARQVYAEHPDAAATAERVIELALPDLTLISFDDAAELELWPVLEA